MRTPFVVSFLVFLLASASAAPDASAAAEAAVRATDAAYVKAWLNNEQRAVLSTLAPDVVLCRRGNTH